MLHTLKPAAWMLGVLVVFTGAPSIAWQNTPPDLTHRSLVQDTTPGKQKVQSDETIINGDLDEAMEGIKKAQEKITLELEDKDWEKLHPDLEKSLDKLNTEDIHKQLAKAMKEIDFQKVQAKIQASMQKIDWKKMQQEMQEAQEEIKNSPDAGKLNMKMQRVMEEAQRAMANLKTVDMKKIEQQLERAKDHLSRNEGHMQEEIERAKKNISKNLKKDLRKELEKAQAHVERAREEIQNYKSMVDEMDKERLLKSGEDYKIVYRSGDLSVNGVKQPENITNKYKHYFKKDHVTIKKEKGDDDKTIHL